MRIATDFEFRNRWWVFGAIYGAAFLLLVLDHQPLGGRLADAVIARTQWSEAWTLHLVFGAGAVLMLASAALRTWGSAYLGRDVVHGESLRNEALRADGPFRYVRNPLYLGNIVMAVAMSLLAPVIGAGIILLGVPWFCYRLIGREEQALEAAQGERFRDFKRAVPRLWPVLRPRIAAGDSRPNWVSGAAAEAFFWSFTVGVTGFAVTLNPLWFQMGMALSPVASWLMGAALGSRVKLS